MWSYYRIDAGSPYESIARLDDDHGIAELFDVDTHEWVRDDRNYFPIRFRGEGDPCSEATATSLLNQRQADC